MANVWPVSHSYYYYLLLFYIDHTDLASFFSFLNKYLKIQQLRVELNVWAFILKTFKYLSKWLLQQQQKFSKMSTICVYCGGEFSQHCCPFLSQKHSNVTAEWKVAAGRQEGTKRKWSSSVKTVSVQNRPSFIQVVNGATVCHMSSRLYLDYIQIILLYIHTRMCVWIMHLSRGKKQ